VSTDFKLRWREGEKAPCEMVGCSNTVVDNGTAVYYHYGVNKIYAYHIPSSSWSPIPVCPTEAFFITVIDGLLTTVGGFKGTTNTNKLYSLTGKGSGRRWTEKFPPMPTKRYNVSALCTGTALIAAGGWGRGDENEVLKSVEVLNIGTREWHIAADLPQPLSGSSMALCGDLIYLLGGADKRDERINSVYFCSLTSLLFSTRSTSLGGRLVNTLARSSKGSLWNRVADLPVKCSTAVSLYGRLLVFGGAETEKEPRTAVHMYQPITNSWEVISHMIIPRYFCLPVVLPDNQLMVVGGFTTGGKLCDSVEFGTIL
jgi:hypothetical protein